MKQIAGLAFVFALCSLAAPAAGDKIVLENGREIAGLILREEPARISVRTDAGTMWIARADIREVARSERTPPKTETRKSDSELERIRDDMRRKVTQDLHKRAEEVRAARARDTAQREGTSAAPKSAADRDAEKTVELLGSDDREDRAKAASCILETWPTSVPALELALIAETDRARIEAVRLLGEEKLGDTRKLIRPALRDTNTTVRMLAARVIRRRAYAEFERDLVKIIMSDEPWRVRQEALRALEIVGAEFALPKVVAAWAVEPDDNRKRRYRRVMRQIVGEDLGDDSAAWHEAVNEVLVGRRELRGGTEEE